MITTVRTHAPAQHLVIHLPKGPMNEAEFFAFCTANPELQIERTAQGEVIVMSPTGWESGRRNALLIAALVRWSQANGSGAVTDSSTGFRLPNGATRSPDAAWVRRARLARFTQAEKRTFLPLCPDFVVELRSETDRREDLLAKMDEYMANGAQLGWLIDPLEQAVTIYRPDAAPVRLEQPATITGDPELPSFTLELGPIWEPDL